MQTNSSSFKVLFGLLLCGHTLVSYAAPTEANTSSFRTLSLINTIDDLLYDFDNEAVSVKARTTSFSRPYPCTDMETVTFYRMLPPVEGETEARRIDLFEIELDGAPGEYLVFMTESPDNENVIRGLVAQNNWEDHPAGNMRVFNLSERHTMVKLDTVGQVKLLPPGQSEIFPYPNNDATQAWLKVATQEDNDDWKLRLGAPQLTLNGTRCTLVLVDEQASKERPLTEDLLIRKLIERTPSDLQSQ